MQTLHCEQVTLRWGFHCDGETFFVWDTEPTGEKNPQVVGY